MDGSVGLLIVPLLPLVSAGAFFREHVEVDDNAFLRSVLVSTATA